MSAELNFTKNKRERKAAALIALAAEKKNGVSSCLADEEMAQLVEGRCSAGEKDRAWVHLSDCRQCYEQWYSLKTQKGFPLKKGVIVNLMQRKPLALIGSGLAVAVSVAVFLNLPHDPLPGRLAEEPKPSLQMAEEAENSFAAGVDAEVVGDEAVSREGSGAAYERIAVEQKHDQVTTKKNRLEKTATILRSAEKSSGATVMSESRMAAAPEKLNPLEKWLEKVREGCRKKRTEEDFWSEIARTGEQLFQKTVVKTQLQEKEVKANEILQLIPRLYDVDSVSKQCELIFAKLAEDGNNK